MSKKKFSFPVNPLVGSSIINILILWKRHRIDLAYYPKFILTFLIACILELFNLYERIAIRKRLKKINTREAPVFIIGLWRSGTTLLHNIMCCDPKAAYTTTFQAVFPFATITQAWWLKHIGNYLIPPDRPFDNVSMNMDFPQEDEYGMAALQENSFYNIFNFPKEFDSIYKNEFFTGNLPPAQKRKWIRHYKMLIKKAQLNTGGSRYISKNPCHLGRIQLLLSLFPDAKFIFIYRNPYKVVESLYRFKLAIFPGTQLQRVPDDFNREKIARLYDDVMKQYFEVRKLIPEGQLLEIRMEDFVKDKLGNLHQIYNQLDIEGFDQAKPYFEKYLHDNIDYSREPYETTAETFDMVNLYAGWVFEKLGYKMEPGKTPVN